jgi:hypothetical protein
MATSKTTKKAAKRTTKVEAGAAKNPGSNSNGKGARAEAETEEKEPENPKKEGQCRTAKFIEIELSQSPEYLLTGTIRGDQLITHAWSEKAKARIREDQADPEGKKRRKRNPPPRDPEAEFQAARYVVDGKDCIPSVALKNAMVRAGMRMGKARADLQEAIYVIGEYLPIAHEDMIAREDYVRIGSWKNRVADLRYRPGYINWSVEFKIQFAADRISPTAVVELLRRAGGIGLCEWRPEKGGQFGAFKIDMESLDLLKREPPPVPDFLAKFKAMQPSLSG